MYSRKQNTDNYQTRIERLLTTGEELQQKIPAKYDSFEDLVGRNGDVERWLTKVQGELSGIYRDQEIASSRRADTGLDLEDISHQDIIDSLEAIVADTMEFLKETVRQTRVFDGKADAVGA